MRLPDYQEQHPPREAGSTRHSQAYIPGLDGLRGLAVLGVIAFHTRAAFSPAPLRAAAALGWVGVDLFFVLSGFLITRLLLEQQGSKGYLARFYFRRGLRTWPLYYAVVLFAFISFQVLHQQPSTQPPWWSYIFFVQNFAIPDFGYYPLQPTWSLAIEEQFYLLWPLVILKCPRRMLPALLVLGFAGLPWIRQATMAITNDFFRVYVYTFCRLDGLLAGALLALYFASDSLDRRKLTLGAWISVLVGATCTFSTVAVEDGSRQESPLLFTGLALLFGGVLALVLCARGIALKFLENRTLRATGRVSFGLYLLQFPAFGIVEKAFLACGVSSADWRITAVMSKYGLLFLLAWMSWRFLEKPFLGLKDRLPVSRVPKARAEAV